MTKDVFTITAEAGIREALETMKKHSVRHLPVVDGSEMTGLVSLGDLKQSILASMMEDLKVRDVMVQKPYVISGESSLEEAARMIYDKSVGCLPVMDDAGELAGIITVKDILKAFIDIMGVLQGGARIDVILKNVNGSFDEVVTLIEAKGGYVISVGMTINEDEPVHHFRLSGGDVNAIAEELVELGYRGVRIIE